MRILLVAHRYLPHSHGGVESWTRAMACGLSSLGHEVAVLARDHRGTGPAFGWQRIEDDASNVYWLQHQLSYARSFRESWNDVRLVAPLLQIFADFDPQIVHLAHPDGWGIVPLEVAREQGLATGATLHDYKWLCGRGQMLHPNSERCERIDEERCARCIHDQLEGGRARSLARRFVPESLQRWAMTRISKPTEQDEGPGQLARQRWRTGHLALLSSLRDCDLLVSPSRFVAKRYADSGLGREIQVISNGLDLDETETPHDARWSPSTRWTLRDDICVGPLHIGFFASAHRSKGLHVLQQAVAALPAGSVHLHVHGPSEGADEPYQTFYGPYRSEQLKGLMDDLDLVALPSTWDENQPMVALEARAFGKPLVVSDAGGLPELVKDGVDGWVLPTGRAEAWAERLAILAANRQDAREAGLRAPPPHNAGTMAAAYLQAYSEAISTETLVPALTAAHRVDDNGSSCSLSHDKTTAY